MARQGFDLQLTRYDDRGWRCDVLHDRDGALADQCDGHVALGTNGRKMSNSWFKYEERVAERLSEFVGLILDALKAPYLFRGHSDLDWDLSPRLIAPTSLT